MMDSLLPFLNRLNRRRLGGLTALPATRLRYRPRVEALEDRWLPSCVTIGGTVYDDANNNGLLDPGEQGIAGNALELHNSSGQVVATAVTDAQGHYLFSADQTVDTKETTQTVTATFDSFKTDWTRTQDVAKFNTDLGTLQSVEIVNDAQFTSRIQVESLDSGPSTVTGTVSGTLTLQAPGMTDPLVTSGSNSQTTQLSAFDGTIDFAGTSGHDFGSQTATGTNSVVLTDPSALANFQGSGTVTLTATAHATSSASGAGNLLSQVNSTSSGQVRVIYHYVPSNCLRPGQYTIVQPSSPPGYLPGLDTNDNKTPLPPSNPHNTIPVTVGDGSSLNNNFGELPPAQLSGFVYLDTNDNGQRVTSPTPAPTPGPIGGLPTTIGPKVQPLVPDPGIPGVTLTLTGTDDQGNAVTQSTQTGSDGSYSFGNLRPGTYALQETPPSGYLNGKTNVGSQGGTAQPNQITGISLGVGVNGVNNNFGELQIAGVGGFVYLDPDNNGVKDPGEPGIGGVAIALTGTDDQGNAVSLTQQTAADGSYFFGGLRAGNYTITETPPVGYLQGQNSLGNLGGTLGNDQFFLALAQGQTGANYNFAELLPAPAAIPIPIPEVTPDTPALSKRDFIGANWMQM